MSDIQKLKKFILDRLEHISFEHSFGSAPEFPKFEVYSQDYLAFAEQELDAYLANRQESVGKARLINCVAHLKRAMDCQLDTFLYVFGLYKVFSERNLKLEKKLDFLGAAGVFTSRTLARLNSIRNQMEHEYRFPEITDIEIYFDLVSAFVAVLQRSLHESMASAMALEIDGETEEDAGHLRISYEFVEPAIHVEWQLGDKTESLRADMRDHGTFAFFLRVFLLLHQLRGFASTKYIRTQLEAL